MSAGSHKHAALALALWAAIALAGGGCAAGDAKPSVPRDSRATQSTQSSATTVSPEVLPEVRVTFKPRANDERMARLLSTHQDLGSRLATSLAPLVAEHAQALLGAYPAAVFTVVGARTVEREVHLFAHESLETYAITGGRLVEQGGFWAPVRIRLSSKTLAPLGIDRPSDGAEYQGSVREMMPEWASRAIERLERDPSATDRVAFKRAVRSGHLAFLEDPPAPPGHADPHAHDPDIHRAAIIPEAAHGFSVTESSRLSVSSGADVVSTSPDGRYAVYSGLGSQAGLLVRDTSGDRWLRIRGPFPLLVDGYAWAGDTLVFDGHDLGTGERRGREAASFHIEVDLKASVVTRVVPFGGLVAEWPKAGGVTR